MALSKEQLDRLDAVLEERRRELLLEIAEEDRQRRDLQETELQRNGDEGDKSIGITGADLVLSEMKRHLEEAREIDAAKQRMAGGRYGVCEDCGMAIAFERLMVMPVARRCARCQEYHDRTHRSMETPSM